MNLRLPPFALIVISILQAQAPARPEFEVASVKPNASGNPGFAVRAMPAGFKATNVADKTGLTGVYDTNVIRSRSRHAITRRAAR